MAVFTISCPECKANLKSPKPVPAGKVITCPKCQVMFSAPAPKPVAAGGVELIEEDDDIITEGVEMVEEPKKAPPKKEARPSRPKGKKKPKSNAPLIIGLAAGLVVVVGLAFGGIFLVKFLMAENLDPVAYIPDKSPFVMGADVNRLATTPVGPLLEQLIAGSPLAAYGQAVGTSPKNIIEKFVMGTNPRPGFLPTQSIVMTSKTPFDKAKLTTALGGSPAVFGNRPVIQSGQNPAQINAVVGSRVVAIVLGPQSEAEDAVRTAGRNRTDGSIAEVAAKASQADVFVVMNPTAPGMADMIKGGPMIPGVPKPDGDALLAMKCIGAWANFSSSELEIRAAVVFFDANAAKSAAEEGKKQVEQLKSSPGAFPPEVGETATVTLNEKTVEYSARIKMSTVESGMKQMEPLLALMKMMGPKQPAAPGAGMGRW
ncbi:MAG: hypothetical protein K1X57_00365 [Gemmataceae bacterium]|nr:hypothetical protein [Gemmataceae bacterium]